MLKMIKGFVCALLAAALACVASAQQLSVTSPTPNAYLGTSNTLTFNITGATYQTAVTANITGPGGTSTVTNNFTPNVNGDISGSLPLSFSSTSTGGSYSIVVTATSSGTTLNTVTIPVTVVVTPPVFLDFTPISGAYVNGTCAIRATISDMYLANWTVQVDGANIPNNTGTTTSISVNWNTSTAINNSSHTITITATDLANNTASESIVVTVDHTKPTINVTFPQSSVPIQNTSIINVIIDFTDVSSSAIDQNGIDVLVETTTGAYIVRAARVSTSALNTTTLRWTGRILASYINLPKKFNIVASAVDLAGNVATPATVTVTRR